VGQKVSEVEEISSTIDFRAFDSQATLASQMVLPDRAWSEVLPADEQTTRAGLIQSANNYWDWLGSDKDSSQVPFGPDCQRTENGTFTTNSHVPTTSCPAFFSSLLGSLGVGYMTVVNRRIIFADTDRGVVGGIATFAAKLNGKVIAVGVTPEIFKVQAGHIQLIEAFFRPDGQSQAGWGEDPASSTAAQRKQVLAAVAPIG
jgi:hypothetical protein